jgi:hypothetical protein
MFLVLPRIELVCLDKQSFMSWSQKFLDKQLRSGVAFNQNLVDTMREDLEKLLHRYELPYSTEELAFREDHPIVLATISILPSFFTYFTKSRALIINMLFLPFVDLLEQPNFILHNTSELVGFETTDTYTIKIIARMYEGVRDVARLAARSPDS